MPRILLSDRNTSLVELMDDPACDPVQLSRTYDWFTRLNPWLARWRAVYRDLIRPALHPGRLNRILDIGCGGGDLLRMLADQATQDGFEIEMTGIDPDARAIQHARMRTDDDRITFRTVHSSKLVEEEESFDIIVSNHVLHHLDEQQLVALLADCQKLCCGIVIHNDIRRDDLAWLLFWPVGVWCRGSFILKDGLRSIRRAWHPEELSRFISSSWYMERQTPFRTLLIHRSES